MGTGTILIGLALFVVVAILVALPLLERRRPWVGPPSTRELLLLERAEAIRTIRELDLDFRTAKLTEEDYRALRGDQVQRAAQILRELDRQVDSDDIDAEIEEQVARLRSASVTCPACGQSARPGDTYCAHCGHSLAATVEYQGSGQ